MPSALEATIRRCLEDAKAEEVVVLDLRGKSTLADAMIVATGRSSVHVSSIADKVARACRDENAHNPKIEGLGAGEWVLIDAGDVIVHVFKPETRAFYNLEKLWGPDRPGESARPAES